MVRAGNSWVADSVLWLVVTALKSAGMDVVQDRFEAVARGKVAVVSSDGGRESMDYSVEAALAADVAVVLVSAPESVGTWILDVADRDLIVPDRLTDCQVGRVVALVCPPVAGEIADVSGLGADLTLLDIVKIVRKGYRASDVADRLRKCVAGRRKALEAVAEYPKAAIEALNLGDAKPKGLRPCACATSAATARPRIGASNLPPTSRHSSAEITWDGRWIKGSFCPVRLGVEKHILYVLWRPSAASTWWCRHTTTGSRRPVRGRHRKGPQEIIRGVAQERKGEPIHPVRRRDR